MLLLRFQGKNIALIDGFIFGLPVPATQQEPTTAAIVLRGLRALSPTQIFRHWRPGTAKTLDWWISGSLRRSKAARIGETLSLTSGLYWHR